jgi:ribosomal protein S16
MGKALKTPIIYIMIADAKNNRDAAVLDKGN